MDRVEAKLDLEGTLRRSEGGARVPYNLQEGGVRVPYNIQQSERKIHHNQGGIGLAQKEEEGLETQQDYQPVFVDGTHIAWPQESNLQQTMRVESNKDPSFLEENSGIRYNPSLLEENTGGETHYNPPPSVDPCSNQMEQSTNHKDQLKQGSQGESVLGNFSRFFQDFQPETSLLAQRRGELEVDGIAAEVEREPVIRDFLEREPVIREVSREPLIREVSREHSRVERISRRVPREELQEFQEKSYRRVPREELLLSASKLNCHHAAQNCSK